MPPSGQGQVPAYSGYQQNLYQPGLSPSPSVGPYGHPSPVASPPFDGAAHALSAPCPTPPRWVPHWSEQDRKWYYVETTGRSGWEVPGNMQALPAMPGYSGQGTLQAHGSQGAYDVRDGHVTQPGHAPHGAYNQQSQAYVGAIPPAPVPSPGEASKKSSSNTMLAAAGGFAAGGVVGYFTKEVLGKCKDIMNIPMVHRY